MEMRVDAAADAAYVTISDELVARTVPFGESLLIDEAASGELVGIEILSLTASVPVDLIAARCGLSDADRAELHRVLGGESA